MAFGWSTFILPFLFVAFPSLLFDAPLHLVAWDFARTCIGIYAGCIAVIGYAFSELRRPARFTYAVLSAAVLLTPVVMQGPLFQSAAVVTCVAVLGLDWWRSRFATKR